MYGMGKTLLKTCYMTREAYRDKALHKFIVGMVEAWQSLSMTHGQEVYSG
jgi:hypothetical protein